MCSTESGLCLGENGQLYIKSAKQVIVERGSRSNRNWQGHFDIQYAEEFIYHYSFKNLKSTAKDVKIHILKRKNGNQKQLILHNKNSKHMFKFYHAQSINNTGINSFAIKFYFKNKQLCRVEQWQEKKKILVFVHCKLLELSSYFSQWPFPYIPEYLKHTSITYASLYLVILCKSLFNQVSYQM